MAWHLFIDDHSVARSTGLDRVIHHPRPVGVVIPADRPWETTGTPPIYVERRPDGCFVAFYTAMWWDIDAAAHFEDEGFRRDRAHHIVHRIAYATSSDGVHWEKPSLRLVEAPAAVDWQRHAPFPSPAGSTLDNNLGVPFVVVANLGEHGALADPTRRYALRLAPAETRGVGAPWAQEPRGYFTAELPDFLGDPNWRHKLVDSGGCFNPRRHLLHYWDEQHQEWASLDQGVTGHWLPSREIARFSSPDLVHWRGESVLYPDAADPHHPDHYDEPMSMTPFVAEGVVFGLLSWFHSDRTHPDGGPVLEPTPEHPHRWPWCRKGTNEMRITISRDGGRTWDRTSSRQAWIPPGTAEDAYDRLVIGCLPPVRVGDEDWFYTTVIDGDHLSIRNNQAQDPYYHDRIARQQTALYVQGHNRYVSLRAGTTPEVLITKPLPAGERLQLNVDASRGRVRVAVAAAEPLLLYGDTVPVDAPHLLKPLPGLGFDDAEPVCANSIEHEVRFKDPAALAKLGDRPVQVLIEMVEADVYGVQLESPPHRACPERSRRGGEGVGRGVQ